jgi:predicted MFS family arabinose efflux permease
MVADLCRRRHFGSAMGAFGTIFDVGHASGPILSGLLVGWVGYAVSFPLMACLLFAAIPVFLAKVPAETNGGNDNEL